MNKRRVVITGLGAVSPLGLDVGTTWNGLLQGVSSAVRFTRVPAEEYSTQFACEITNFEAAKYFTKMELRRIDMFSQFMLVATDEAMADSGLEIDKEDSTRAGCILGTGIGGIYEIERGKETALERGPSRMSPFFIPKMIANAPTGMAAIRYGLRGTAYTTVSACASSSHAIGMAMRSIQWGESDLMLTGGCEAAISQLGLGGFCAMKAMSTRNDDPKRASRPFDRERDGFVMGEGAGALVLEEYEHARARGAQIYAEILGYGSTNDAFHITAPHEDADGPTRAINLALQDSAIAPDLVDYVNAHGTSTELNDKCETLALKKVMGDHAYKVPVSSIKSMVGHLLGGSGAIELLATSLTVQRGQIPPTINYEFPDPDCDLDYVPNEAREGRVDIAISNSLGFGGHNTCLVVGRHDR